ncbi:MAG: cytochrome-c peroxidase [Winogradskyella sp.]|uniref:cytochrome-c peroxidase n=1 Tax=Winogradskyella sp. TaxID=1883156 RepID=UPI0017E6743D|nr:cytochrome c peroxidase [Winogradskyella sp.]MBT8244326.1 cytochrome-c peroxidase [Winogradskyella sp.]NNK22721.1 cytochrome-c peroxidase [Winogradskyella sp.]
MKTWIYILILISLLLSCSSDNDEGYSPLEITPTPVNLEIPQIFSNNILPPVIPTENPLTEQGIALGKRLFFDRILSGDQTISCASCHSPQNAFTDDTPTSIGIDGINGTRNSMPLFNLAWNYNERFAWDGKELSLERQALEPVENPIEMHSDWGDVVSRLQNHPEYPQLFEEAFETTMITKELTVKAIAQFERTLISANSKFDRYTLGQTALTTQELNGLDVFLREDKGDCFHCHGSPNNPLWTNNDFHNNGLDATFTDLGLGAVTGDPNDNGKFRTPSLRNLAFTAPYMHDGRFATLEEVIDFYSEGLQNSATIDPLMKNVTQGGVQLSDEDRADLKVFLLSLSDPSFLTNPAFQN